jgi:hypothetical protein
MRSKLPLAFREPTALRSLATARTLLFLPAPLLFPGDLAGFRVNYSFNLAE